MTLIISLDFGLAQTITQDVISNGGETHSQINGSMQFNIGETFVDTYLNNDSPEMYLGFEQGSYSVTSIKENKPLHLVDILLYPNPSSGIFNLSISSIEGFKYKITDNLGKKILNSIIDTETNLIDISKVERGIYNLTVYNETIDYQKTFQILKQ